MLWKSDYHQQSIRSDNKHRWLRQVFRHDASWRPLVEEWPESKAEEERGYRSAVSMMELFQNKQKTEVLTNWCKTCKSLTCCKQLPTLNWQCVNAMQIYSLTQFRFFGTKSKPMFLSVFIKINFQHHKVMIRTVHLNHNIFFTLSTYVAY